MILNGYIFIAESTTQPIVTEPCQRIKAGSFVKPAGQLLCLPLCQSSCQGRATAVEKSDSLPGAFLVRRNIRGLGWSFELHREL
jgi:hypothetical protein